MRGVHSCRFTKHVSACVNMSRYKLTIGPRQKTQQNKKEKEYAQPACERDRRPLATAYRRRAESSSVEPSACKAVATMGIRECSDSCGACCATCCCCCDECCDECCSFLCCGFAAGNKTAPGPATGRQAPSDANVTVNAGGGAKGSAAELVAPAAVVATPGEEPSSAAVVGDEVDDASKSS